MQVMQNRGVEVAASAAPMPTTTMVSRMAAMASPRAVRRKLKCQPRILGTDGLALWTWGLWHSAQPNPSECRAARPWQRVQTELGGVPCPAWYLPAWQVRQLVMPDPNADPCSALV